MNDETPYRQFKELRPAKRIVAEALREKEFESVLEAGVQWGENLMAIKEKFPDKKLIVVDIDKPVIEEAKVVTALDLRVGNLFDLQFADKEFDVVFAEALFVMLPPHQIESGIDELLRVTKKYLILVELGIKELTGYVPGGRTGANWVEIFKARGLNAKIRKISVEEWNAEPWRSYGYVIEICKD